MIVSADTSVVLDFLEGVIEDPYPLIRPYQLILMSPVAFHEVLRTLPEETHPRLVDELKLELLPAPTLEHWMECAHVMRELYPMRQNRALARMQNDVLIALSARDAEAPVWSRDKDFESICTYLGIGLIKA